jgi:hypothetical protein
MHLRRLFPVLLIIFLTVLLGQHSRTAAQGQNDWSPLETVYANESGRQEVRPAQIVTDSEGNAHLFWLQKFDKDDPSNWYISYSHWNGGTWSPVNDVLQTPGGGAGAPLVILTTDGKLHVFWADSGSVWVSEAPLHDAPNAQAWSVPFPISSNGALELDVALDQAGAIHLVYASGEMGGELYYQQSADGLFWATERIVHIGSDRTRTAMHPQIAVDDQLRLHVVWTEYELPEGWPPLGQYYAKSVDGGYTWSVPRVLGEGEEGQGTVLAVGDNQVHIVWRGTSGAGNTYHLWSEDGGDSWNGPRVFDSDGGFSGVQSLAADSAGNIHLVRGDGGYQTWDGQNWSPVPALFAGSGETGTLAIGLGNQIHWVNTTTSGDERAIVWHRSGMAAAPALPPEPLPSPTPRPPEQIVVAQPEVAQAATERPPLPDFPRDETQSAQTLRVWAPFILGAGAVAFLLLLTLVVWTSRAARYSR